MARTEFTVAAADGSCVVSLHVPAGVEKHPGVVLYPDAGGARETFCAMGDRLAALGYVVLVPDVYYRVGRYEPFAIDTVFSDPVERGRLLDLAGTLTPAMSVADADTFVDALTGRPEVTPGPVGTVGYCMGGRADLVDRGGVSRRASGGLRVDPWWRSGRR